jgi:hypothetical protein
MKRNIVIAVLGVLVVYLLATRPSRQQRTTLPELPDNGTTRTMNNGNAAVDCYDTKGNLQPDEAVAFSGFTVGCAPGQITKLKTERAHVKKARLDWVEQVESCQKSVVDSGSARTDSVDVYRKKLKDCVTAPPQKDQ